MIKVLAIDSDYDWITGSVMNHRETYVYSHINANFIRCQVDKATREEVLSKIGPNGSDIDIKYITGSGHGSGEGNIFYGQVQITDGNSNEEIIWRKRCPLLGGPQYKKEEVENRIVHLLSCATADVLGPDMVDKGCLAFFGYSEDFWAREETIELCVYADSEIDLAFLDGENAEIVYLRTVIAYIIAQIILVREDLFDFAAEIQHNLDYLKCPHHDEKWGDKRARLI